MLFACIIAGVLRVTQRDAHSGKQLTGTKWLREIIIGAVVERTNLLLILVAGRKNDDRRRQPFAQPPNDFLTIHVGQTEIKNHEIGRKLRSMFECLVRGGRFVELILSVRKFRAKKSSELVARLRPIRCVVMWQSLVKQLQNRLLLRPRYAAEFPCRAN